MTEQRIRVAAMLHAVTSLTRLEKCSLSTGWAFDSPNTSLSYVVADEAAVQGEGWLCRKAGMKSGMVVFALFLANSSTSPHLRTLCFHVVTPAIRCDKGSRLTSHEVVSCT